MGAGGQQPGDARDAGEVPVHDPQSLRGEQVRVILQRLVQQRLLGFALVPAAAGGGAGRAGGHGQGGAGGGVRQPQVPLLGVGRGIIGGAGRAERLPVRRGVGHPGQRPVDRAGVQVSHDDRPVVMVAVLGVDAGQHQVPQLFQRAGPERLPPGAGHRRGRQRVRPLPRHRGQVSHQGRHHLGVVRVRRHQRHQQGEPDRQRRRHRPPRRALDLAPQRDARRDLPDHIRPSGQGIDPLLGHAEPGVLSRVPGGLHPPVPADQRRRHRHRLEEDHRIPAADLPRTRHDQRRPAVLAQARPGRRGQVGHPDRHHARLPEQAQAGIFRAGGRDIRPRDRVEEHQEAPVRERLLDHFLFYREPPVHSGTRTGVSRTDHAQAPPL